MWCALFGLIIGSFLNVVLYRFNTGKSVTGRSRCLSCGQILSWLDLIPVVSYLWRRGRCAYCGARIPVRYVLVEIATGGLFLLSLYVVGLSVLLPLYFILMALLMCVVVYDMAHTIIPDRFVIILVVCAGAIAILESWGDTHAYALRALGGALSFLFFASLWLLSEGRWVGLGDAKLALPLGIIASWPTSLSMLILSFWVGAAVSVTLLMAQRLLQRGQQRLRFLPVSLTIKSEVPFAPFLVVGFFLAHFFAVDAFDLIFSIMMIAYS